MKKLTFALKMLIILLVFAFTACKKDNKNAIRPGDETNIKVTTDDLLPYSIGIFLNIETPLRIVYFNKEGNEVKAIFDFVNARRILPVNIVDNTWAVDLNGDKSVIYTFVFDKDKAGKLSLTTARYINRDDASIIITTIKLSKNADLPEVANTKLNDEGSYNFLKFSNEHSFAMSNRSDYAGAAWSDYYELCKGAWKGKYNGVDYMGVTLHFPPRPPVMWVEKTGDSANGPPAFYFQK